MLDKGPVWGRDEGWSVCWASAGLRTLLLASMATANWVLVK